MDENQRQTALVSWVAAHLHRPPTAMEVRFFHAGVDAQIAKIGHCRDCRFWIQEYRELTYVEPSKCGLLSPFPDQPEVLAQPISDGEYWGWLQTDADFGCIHFEAKTDGS